MAKTPETIQRILDNSYEQISERIDHASGNFALFGCCDGKITEDICYKRLIRKLNERHGRHNHLHSIMSYFPQWFDYEKLFQDINNIFGGVFKIEYVVEDNEQFIVVKITEKHKFESQQFLFSSYLLLLVMLRLIDTENKRKWRDLFAAEPDREKYTNFKDVVLDIHSKVTMYGHALNDNIKHLGDRTRIKDVDKSYTSLVDNYFEVLTEVFSRENSIEEVDTKKPARYKGQTPTFDYIKHNYARKRRTVV